MRDEEARLEASAHVLVSGFAATAQAFAEMPARLEASASALAGGLEEYARAGIVERTEHGGYRATVDVAEAELRELERRRPSRASFRLAVIREVRSSRRSSRPPVVHDRGSRPRRPAGRRRGPPTSRSDSGSDPDLDDADDVERSRAGDAELDSANRAARRRSSC